MTAIFISHSSKDNVWAAKLRDWLTAAPRCHRGLFLDVDREAGLKAGDLWEQELYAKLRQCQVVIALVSPNWLASRWCFAEAVQAREKGKRLILARIDDTDKSRLFPDAQQLDFVADEGEAFTRLEIALADVFDLRPDREPYPGLVPFDERDAGVFVGRDPEIAALTETLESMRLKARSGERLLLLLGASGSGKSSLVRAGVLPRLRTMPERWLVLPPMRAGLDPVRELGRSLAVALQKDQLQPILDRLAGEGSGAAGPLADLVDDALLAGSQSERTALLVLDQMEELLGVSEAQSQRRFLELMRRALASGDGRLIVLGTLRSDFLGEIQLLPFLTVPNLLPYGEQTLDPVSLDRLDAIVREPGRRWPTSVEFEDPLVERIKADTGTRDTLPLLAFTLNRLWRDKDARADGLFMLGEYERIGGIEGSVRMAADQALDPGHRTVEDRQTIRDAFVPGLVRVDADGVRTRRRVALANFPARARSLLSSFVDLGLLVTKRETDGTDSIEVAHEALLRTWPQLDAWLTDDQDKLRILNGLERAARDWAVGAQSPDLLVHRGGRLAEVRTLASEARFRTIAAGQPLAYLDACTQAEAERDAREAEERDRRLRDAERIAAEERRSALIQRRVSRGSIAALVIVSLLATVAFSQWRSSVRKGIAAEAQAEGLAGLDHFEAARSLDGLRTALRGGKALQRLVTDRDAFEAYPATSPLLALQVILDNIYEKTRVEPPPAPNQPAPIAPPAGSLDCKIALADRSSVPLGSLSDEQIAAVMGFQRRLMAKACSPDGRYVVAAAADLTVRLRASDSILPATTVGLHGGVRRITFAADSRSFTTANVWDSTVAWAFPSANVARHVTVLAGDGTTVQSVRFSPSGRMLVTVSRNGTAVQLWTGDGQRQGSPITSEKQVVLADFTADEQGITTVSKDGAIDTLDLAGRPTGRYASQPGQNVIYAAISADRTHLALATAGGGGEIVELAAGRRSPLRGNSGGWIYGLDFLPDGKRLITAGADDTIRFWTLAGQPQGAPISAGQGQVLAVAADPSRDLIVSTGDDGTVKLWTTAGAPSGQLIGHRGKVLGVGFSADGALVGTSGGDGTFRLWSLAGANLLRVQGYLGPSNSELSGGDFGTPGVGFGADGRHFAVPRNDGTVALLRFQTLDELVQGACAWLGEDIALHPVERTLCPTP